MLSALEIFLFKNFVRPGLFELSDPEDAHFAMVNLAAKAQNSALLKFLMRKFFCYEDAGLEADVGNLHLKNPVGLAGGFDKDGRFASMLPYVGFGFSEVGTITQKAWPGRARPRIARFPDYESAANWMGFPGESADAVIPRIANYNGNIPLLANFGATADVVADVDTAIAAYVECYRKLKPYFRHFVVNKSSPNTTGLRQLSLEGILLALLEEDPGIMPNLWIKIAPDSSSPEKTVFQELDELIEMHSRFGYAGLIAANTTTDNYLRDMLGTRDEQGAFRGGVSGDLVIAKTMPIIRYLQRNAPEIPKIAVGGIKNPGIAIDYIRSGAHALEVMTPLFYQGPALARYLNEGIANYLRKEGVKNYTELIGTSVSPNRTMV